MRLPNRKPGKYTFSQFDPVMTQEKFQALQAKLEHIKKEVLPQAIKDTQLYAENGDFSENAEYQIAKARLRGLNKTVDELQHQITHAKIIPKPKDNVKVQIGHTVVVSVNNTLTAFRIKGSTEVDLQAGIISYQSPIGALLLGHSVGDTVTLQLAEKKVEYKIVEIR